MPETQADPNPDETVIACPECFRETDSLKTYRAVCLFSALIIYNVSFETVVACPSCMRKNLLARLLMMIPIANILFPFVAISYVSQILSLIGATKGHTDPIAAEQFRISRAEQQSHLAEIQNLPGAGPEIWVVLFFVLVGVSILGVAVYFVVAS